MSNAVFAFSCGVKDAPWPDSIINHRTAGKARAAYYRELQESWPDIPFTAIHARKVGQPRTDAIFEHVAQYRGMPDLRCGQRVVFTAARGERVSGVLVTAGGGANFGTLCDTDMPKIWSDSIVYVHPSELEVSR